MRIDKLRMLNLKTFKQQSISDRNVAKIIKTKLELSIKSDTYTGRSQKI